MKQREIKFRAWDADRKVMRYPKPGDVVTINEKGEMEYHFGPYTKCIIQLFTGLKDRNGKEIYEGDIVKCNDLFIRPVGFDNGAFVTIAEGQPLLTLAAWQSLEVIGSIYENPELLRS